MEPSCEPKAAVLDGRIVLNPEALKAHRRRLGLSQDGLADLCFERRAVVSIASIKRAESGRSVLYRTARNLARIYQVEVEALVEPAAALALAAALPATVAAADDDAAELRTVVALRLDPPPPAALAPACAALVTQFGGQLLPAGAGGFAVFGLPRAFRSDAERALRSAIALARLLHDAGQRIELGLAGWPGPAAAPDAPPADLALRGSAVLLRSSLAPLLRDRFLFEPAGADWLLWRGERSDDLDRELPLCGRHLEVSHFKSIAEAAVRDQWGHVVYVRGVAGIGKSRLTAECREIAQQSGLSVHQGNVLDFGGEGGLSALAALVEGLLGGADAQLGAALAMLPVEAACALRPLLGLPQPAGLAGVDVALGYEQRMARLRDAVGHLILQVAVRQPLLLVLEDIHWADRPLFELLGGLIHDLREAPVLWLLTSRHERDPLDSQLRPGLADAALTLLDLAPLRATEAAALAAQFDAADADWRERCVAQAQGNPLFLTQLLHGKRLGAVPDSLRNLVQTKFDELSRSDCRTLRAACAIGPRFGLALLRQVIDEPDYQPELPLRQHLLRALGGGDYGFVHDLIQRAIHDAMPAAQRCQLHRRIAAAYAGSDAMLHALHLHRARDAAAPAALAAAARDKLALHQYPAALELARAGVAVDYAPTDPVAAHLLCGEIAARHGLTQEAHDRFAAAHDQAGDVGQRLAAAVGLARMLNLLERLDAEERLIDTSLPLAQAAGESARLAELHYLKGNLYFPRGDFATLRHHQSEALRHARGAGAVETEARALSGLGDSYYAEGRMTTAASVFRDCLALCERHGLVEIEAANRFMLGTVRLYANQTELALADALASAEIGSRAGNRRATVVSRLTAGWAWLSLGRPDAALPEIEAALALALELGVARFEPFLLESRARAHWMRGASEAARADIRRARAGRAVAHRQLHRPLGAGHAGAAERCRGRARPGHRRRQCAVGRRLRRSQPLPLSRRRRRKLPDPRRCGRRARPGRGAAPAHPGRRLRLGRSPHRADRRRCRCGRAATRRGRAARPAACGGAGRRAGRRDAALQHPAGLNRSASGHQPTRAPGPAP
ncbi:ATP-binding protein [Derxia lacustris]|uniref:ATP-binding protein n=1 Tax=Derxia lacustris TaxID=764842 RepID=UPI000A16FAB4|nr:helix-turn-helix domain-containing protein [Derxia lacustris]